MARPYRSVLYIPAANARAMEKARGLAADAIIFDLEDAVAPDQKQPARDGLAQALSQDYGPRARILRINALTTEWGRADAMACAGMVVDAVLIPKVDGPADLDAVAELLPETPLWAMMETPAGMLNAQAIAAHPRLQGMVMGTNDLAKDIGSRFRPDRLPMMAGLGLCLLAARAHDRVIVDGVFNAFRDEDGLRVECEQGRDMGFDGKTLIHPAQLAVANEVFAPTQPEIDLARRQIEAFDQAQAAGQGVAVVDGRIVENLHVETARRTLDRAQAIAAMAE
ncbi:CoA ester lyase [Paracoccus sp. 1_MG-2023]|uniref:HpcH/HpaI aldolase/citrate lyase family protein n=1 Tax=unclassified Paracoccus (in: a-proteobacteria) TaxID=2688777 RepID=UPI001C09D5F8|nr:MULTISPECIES: CoA ester lyase [unclassified Paracoccus (in: a-proteobacteria)]MBU2958534.1 CoA ester lyase [Paracoccus sp. C2R09]MDO6668481.1 CoA ester lyase [Paracoccus sp. 1_MG-2023]